MNDPRSSARAVVLAATLTFEPRPLDPFALRVTTVRREVHSARGPLDLDAAIFRYGQDGTVIRAPAGARFCSASARRESRSSRSSCAGEAPPLPR